jgi:MFS family permease
MKESLHISFRRGPFLANRDFLIASSGRFVGTVGYGAVVVSIVLHIQTSLGDSRQGAWPVTGFLLISTLPMVLLAPWAGRVADTRDSRRVATVSSLASALAVAAMAMSMHMFSDYLPALYVLTFVLEAALAVGGPTWQALPRIVGEERTPRAMGSMQATLMLAQMVGPAVGGILVGRGGTQFSFWTAGGCYLLLAAGALAIRTRRGGHHALGQSRSAKPRLLDGLRVLNGDRLLWSLLVGALFIILAAEAINVLEVFLARESLGASAGQYGLLSAVMALGLVAGSLAAGRIRTQKRRLEVFLASVAASSAVLILMGLAPTLMMLFVFNAAAGAGIGALNATFGALILLRTPEANRGQVTAIVMGLTRAASIGALGAGGLLGSVFGPRTGFVLCGAAAFVVSVVVAVVVLAGQPVLDTTARRDTSADGDQEAVPDKVPDVLQQPADPALGTAVVLPRQ